ncbi:uncharacterized protein [Eurosta solidaginis]
MDEGALSSSRNVEHNEGEVEEASTSVPPLGNLHSHNVELFDPAMDLDELSLPTAFDILKFYFFLADQIRKANKIFTYKAFTPNVYDKLIEIWSKLNIDLLDKRAVTKNYMHYFTNTRNCLRPDDIWKNLKVSLMRNDRTQKNLGRGILRRFEKQLNRELHWWICLLHFNELPFRHLYETLEKSRSTGPRTSTGSLEKDLHNCHNQQVVTNFEAIPLENMPPPLDEDEEKKLSTDSKYLYKIANAISNGYVPPSLAMITPGPIIHARWLTKAYRIFRLYATINTPSENLKILATYIMFVYVPMYFNVKY